MEVVAVGVLKIYNIEEDVAYYVVCCGTVCQEEGELEDLLVCELGVFAALE